MSMTLNQPLEERMIGMKVIYRSNENGPLLIGTLEAFSKKVTPLPSVIDELGKQWFVGGIIVPYSPELHQILEGMTPQKQWEWLSDLTLFTRIINSRS